MMADIGSKTGDSDKKKRWRENVVRLTLEILESEKDYQVLNVLGCGTYGDVFHIYDPKREVDIAAKIVTSDNISEMELHMWPKLNHPNIVPLLELLTLNPLEVAIFIMPLQYKTLHDLLFDRRFSKSRNCSSILKRWMYEILCAIGYMHGQEMCHLDIKVDNVLITHTFTAMLCDFSFLNETTKPLDRYDLGLPYIYRPPEACQSLDKNISVNGTAYDMWGYGLMLVEIFTHLFLAKTLMDCKCWFKEVYPILFDILQEDAFKTLLFRSLPGIETDCEPTLALNFIHMFLKVDPLQRSSAEEAKQHVFLGTGSINSDVDEIWRNKVKEIFIISKRKDDGISEETECSNKRNSQSIKEDYDHDCHSGDDHSDNGLEAQTLLTKVSQEKFPIGASKDDLFTSVEISTSHNIVISNFQSFPSKSSTEGNSSNIDSYLHIRPIDESCRKDALEKHDNVEPVSSNTSFKLKRELKTPWCNLKDLSPEQSKKGSSKRNSDHSPEMMEAKNNCKIFSNKKIKVPKASQNTKKHKLNYIKTRNIPKYKQKMRKLIKRNCVNQKHKKSTPLDKQSNICKEEPHDLDNETTLTEEHSTCPEGNIQEISTSIQTETLLKVSQTANNLKDESKSDFNLRSDSKNFSEKAIQSNTPQKSASAEFDLTSGIEKKWATGDFQQPYLSSSAEDKETDLSTDLSYSDNLLLPGYLSMTSIKQDQINSYAKDVGYNNDFAKYVRSLRLQVNQLDGMVRELERKVICKSCARSHNYEETSVSAELNSQNDNSLKSEKSFASECALFEEVSVSNKVHFQSSHSSKSKEELTSGRALFEETSVSGKEHFQSDNSLKSINNFASTSAFLETASVSNEEHSQNEISSKSTEEFTSRHALLEEQSVSDEEHFQNGDLSKSIENLASKIELFDEIFTSDKEHSLSDDSSKSREELFPGNSLMSSIFLNSVDMEEKDLTLKSITLQTESTESDNCFMNDTSDEEFQISEPNICLIVRHHNRFLKWLRKRFLKLERILKYRKYHLMK